jgi:putative PIN family toxin of toxin-antitoxin system
VVIDTNIWISFLIGKSLADLSEAIIHDRIKILFSTTLFAELIEVLQRQKLKTHLKSIHCKHHRLVARKS